MTARGSDEVNDRWFVVSLQRRYQGDMPGTRVELRIGDASYGLSIDGSMLESFDGAPADPHVTIEGPLLSVVSALTGGDDAGVRHSGDTGRYRELLRALTPSAESPR
jgi:hypothetical protein